MPGELLSVKKIILITAAVLVALLLIISITVGVFVFTSEPFQDAYEANCADCHGTDLEGSGNGTPLSGPMHHGATVAGLMRDIAAGNPDAGMPAFSGVLTPTEIKGIAIYIAERRVGRRFREMRIDAPLVIPVAPVSSEVHDFRIEVVTADLQPNTYSVAALPEGGFLVTEKLHGLKHVSADGEVSALIPGAPVGYDDGFELHGLNVGTGHILEVAIHPDYARNGWIYLHYGHRCADCNRASRESWLPVSMNRVIRGRLRDGEWVDEEVIWQADDRFYTTMADTAAGGRLAFDGEGYLYMSIGLKGLSNFEGPQDMGSPYGKVFRLHDDGRIPNDNPFIGQPGVLPEIWTYGHRTPQGLEFDRGTHTLWGTEHGPRGGDELNILRSGRNYGWPLYSKGLDYNLTEVEYGKDLHLEFVLEDIEQPVFDFTPSPAVSNLKLYEGTRFPGWQRNLFVGSLAAADLFRLVVEDNRVVHEETLIKDLARIRDIETGPDGLIYLLLENDAGGMLVRLVPETEAAGTLSGV